MREGRTLGAASCTSGRALGLSAYRCWTGQLCADQFSCTLSQEVEARQIRHSCTAGSSSDKVTGRARARRMCPFCAAWRILLYTQRRESRRFVGRLRLRRQHDLPILRGARDPACAVGPVDDPGSGSCGRAAGRSVLLLAMAGHGCMSAAGRALQSKPPLPASVAGWQQQASRQAGRQAGMHARFPRRACPKLLVIGVWCEIGAPRTRRPPPKSGLSPPAGSATPRAFLPFCT